MTNDDSDTILVVDDDRLVLATLAHGLSQAGYRVIDADNGDDAILLAREHRPDLALLDIRMQGMSGFDVAACLRQTSRVPFMFLSAFCDAHTTAQAAALGAIACLTKPLDIRQILPAVAQALAQLRSARQATPVAPASDAVRSPEVLMAVGVLMHRHSLARETALEQLRHMAAAERLSLDEHARRLVRAVEMLALPVAA
ncbi:ANTAR domain-containing response regulator [Rhizobacter fulvus]|jgi:response regulator NasT